MTALNWFGRRMLAWPAALLGAIFATLGGECLRFAAWMIDADDLFDDAGDWKD